MTSRWVVEVTAARDIPVRWRAYSLAIKNEGNIPEQFLAMVQVTRGALRVVEAVWAEHGDEPIGRLYTELGRRFHHQGDISRESVVAALEAAGLDPALIAAADDEKWDAEIRSSMAEAIALVGDEVGVPILEMHEGDRTVGISGPIMSPAPRGEAALAAWDSVVSLAFTDGFFEVKRSRTTGPQLAPLAD